MLITERQRSWLERDQSFPVHPVMRFTEDRLELAAGTVLARMIDRRGEARILDIPGHEKRILALLAAAYRRPISPRILGNIRRAGREWARGEACLAQIHLALTGLPKLDAADDSAYRLFMAEGLLDTGVPPRDILRALDLDPAPLDFLDKAYNPAEARVPGGSGHTSGEWTIGGTLGSMAATAETFFVQDLAPEVLTGLSDFAAAFSAPAIALGLLVIPSPTESTIADGDVPDHPGLRYRWDREEGSFVLAWKTGGLQVPVQEAHAEPDGIYYDRDRHPIAREVDGGLLVNADAVTAQANGRNDALDTDLPLPLSQARTKDQPQLCPDPGPDVPHGASDRAIAYQTRITGLPPGLAVWLNGVAFDGCREEDGTMLEAKGPAYAGFIDKNGEWHQWYTDVKGIEKQLEDQSKAAGSRRVEWHVAEKIDADKIRAMVASNSKLSNIDVIWDP